MRIPKGSLVFVVPWLLHRHKKLWDKPDHFIPERFLPENPASISKFAYIPFSIGPRICAGMSFGLTEAILCLATLAQKFKLRLKPGHSTAGLPADAAAGRRAADGRCIRARAAAQRPRRRRRHVPVP